MKSVKPWQIGVIMLLFAAALVGYTLWTNPNAARPHHLLPREGVHVRLWFNHLCCDGCLDDVTEALSPFPWLGKPVPPPEVKTQDQANQAPAPAATGVVDYSGYVDVPILKLADFDLMVIDRALRAEGFVPHKMELGGLERFRLSAELPHLCCGMCRSAAEDAFSKSVAGPEIKWLDHVSVNKQMKLVVAHARYLAPGDGADLVEFVTRLNAVGYAPTSVHVLAGDESAAATKEGRASATTPPDGSAAPAAPASQPAPAGGREQ